MKSFVSFVLLPIGLASVGEFILKHAINHIVATHIAPNILTVALHPLIGLGTACIVSAGLLWVVAMSRYQLSYIYPFFSLNFVIILVGSSWLLGEQIHLARYLAVVLIIIGLIFISRSPFSKSKAG